MRTLVVRPILATIEVPPLLKGFLTDLIFKFELISIQYFREDQGLLSRHDTFVRIDLRQSKGAECL